MRQLKYGWLHVGLLVGFTSGWLACVFLMQGHHLQAHESRAQDFLQCDHVIAKVLHLQNGDGPRIQFVMEKDGSLNSQQFAVGKEGKLRGQLQFRATPPPP